MGDRIKDAENRFDLDAPPAFLARDAFLLAYLPVVAMVAWCVPERWWDPLCRAGVRGAARLRPKRRERQRDYIGRRLRRHLHAEQADRLVEALAANYHRSRLYALRSYAPGGWEPRIQLNGRAHVERALAAGKGGILWVTPMAFSDLVTKIAFHRAGFAVSHLSRFTHGFSPSRFGARVLNPIWTRVESRYLAERLVMNPGQSIGALRELARRVRENRLVSVTVGNQGQRTVMVPFFDETVAIAEGAPALARRSGAALLPVFTVQLEDGSFVTTVEPALQAPLDLDREAAVRVLVTAYAALLESYIARFPDQSREWKGRPLGVSGGR